MLNLLFNDVTLGDVVAYSVLDASVEHQNTDTLEAVLKHLFHSNKMSERHLISILEETTSAPIISDYLERYLAKVVVKSRVAFSIFFYSHLSTCN